MVHPDRVLSAVREGNACNLKENDVAMTKRHRWSAMLMVLALVACDEPSDPGADAAIDRDAGELPADAGEADGGSGTDAGPLEAPTVTSVTPSNIARGATLVIEGSYLLGATEVTIGGTAQTIGANDADSIRIDAVASETPLGEQDVVVTTAGGESEPITVTVIEPLGVAGASAVDPLTVSVTFTRELDPSSVDPDDFTIEGLTVSEAVASGSTVTLATGTQTSGATYTVEVAGVTDTFGNVLSGASSAMFTGFDAEAPTIITISAGEVVREFSELTITGTNLSGGAVTIGGAPQPIVSMSDTEIVAGPITAETPLGIQPVMVTTGGGNSGTMNVEVLEPFRMLLPTATSETTVDVKLNREVDVSTVAPERFTIGGLTVESASASGDTITLTTSAQVPEATYTISASGLRDRLGAPITSDTVSFQGFQPPPPSEFIVVRVGDGTTPPGDVAAPVFLERRSIADGSLIGTLPLPTAASGANHPLTLVSGPNGYSEGSLSRSEDGRFLAIAGYPAAPGDANPNSGTEARVVAIIDADDFGPTPNVDTSTRLGAAFVGTRPWGAVIDGTNIWAVGGWGGVHHVERGGSSNTVIAASPSAGRAIRIFGGKLYFATISAPGPGIYRFSGLPTTTAANEVVISHATGADPWSFAGFDLDSDSDIDTLYVANRGVERWVKSGDSWTLSTSWTGPARHVACVQDRNDVLCVASSTDNLFAFRDVGGNSTGTSLTALPNGGASANTNYRGVAFPPVP